MKTRFIWIVLIALPLLLIGGVVLADSCTWSDASDGGQQAVCVDDNGQMYCLHCPAGGGACSRVSCF